MDMGLVYEVFSGLGRMLRRLSLMMAVSLLPIACSPGTAIQPIKISPLSGTWTGINDPGGGYLGTLVFDITGDLVSLDIRSYKATRLYFVFDRQPHSDSDGSSYVARATTTESDHQFQVKALIEYTGGGYEGLTWITVEGTVDAGTMSGTVRIAFPGSDPFTMDFKGARA